MENLMTTFTTSREISAAQGFESPEVARQIEHIVVPANEQNLDRLTAEVLGESGR